MRNKLRNKVLSRDARCVAVHFDLALYVISATVYTILWPNGSQWRNSVAVVDLTHIDGQRVLRYLQLIAIVDIPCIAKLSRPVTMPRTITLLASSASGARLPRSAGCGSCICGRLQFYGDSSLASHCRGMAPPTQLHQFRLTVKTFPTGLCGKYKTTSVWAALRSTPLLNQRQTYAYESL